MSTRNAFFFAGSIVTLLGLAGCSPTLVDGRFSCGPGIECPTGFSCRTSDMLCYRASGESDAGGTMDAAMPREAGPEASTPDASGDAGGDASGGCGPNCFQLVVLNADPDTIGSIEFSDNLGATQHIPIPPYGTTSATINVPNVTVPGTLQLNVPPTATVFHEVTIPAEGRYLLVLGPASIGASVLLLAQPRTGLHTDGYVYIQLVDMTADETVGLIASGAGRPPSDPTDPNPFEHDMISDPLAFLPGSSGALRLEIDPAAPQLIAALLADQIPDAEGTYYLVVSGRVNAHLDADNGLRFIPGIPSSTALRSGRLVRFIDTVGTTVTVCDDLTAQTTLLDGALSPPFVPPRSGAWALTIHTGTSCIGGLTRDVAVGAAVGRTLVSIAGDLAMTWGVVSIPEPPPPGAGNSTIVIHNALSYPTDIAGALAVPSLGTSSVTVVSPPPTISAGTMAGTKTFAWSPVERQAWVVVTDVGDGTFRAYEVDSPFRARWTLTVTPSD